MNVSAAHVVTESIQSRELKRRCLPRWLAPLCLISAPLTGGRGKNEPPLVHLCTFATTSEVSQLRDIFLWLCVQCVLMTDQRSHHSTQRSRLVHA